jgi:hypothetical protein
MSFGFEIHKWPQRHTYTIQECGSPYVHDFTWRLSDLALRRLPYWKPVPGIGIVLIAHQSGVCRRWWFVCQKCKRRCESLYQAPEDDWRNWRCRRCCDLIYASQRYGPWHPLNRTLAQRRAT